MNLAEYSILMNMQENGIQLMLEIYRKSIFKIENKLMPIKKKIYIYICGLLSTQHKSPN